MKNTLLLFGTLSLVALLAYSCGGGGDGYSTNYNALFSGSYQINQIGDSSASGVVETLRADATADGTGAGTMNIPIGNHSAGVAGSGVYSYSVAADRTFKISTATGSVDGILSANGNIFILSDTNRTVSDTPPEDAGAVMAIGMNKSSGLTIPLLSGDYQIHQAGDSGAGLNISRVDVTTDVTTDGSGAGTWNISAHSEGIQGGLGASGVFSTTAMADRTFSVTTKDANGTVTIGTDHGIMSADGSMFVLSDTNLAASSVPPIEDAEIILAVGIKRSSGLTNAAMNGNYQIHQISTGPAGRYTARMNITADGAGNGTWSSGSHSAGETGSGTFTYDVAADGTFTATTMVGATTIGTDQGIISADGSMFVITDTDPVAKVGPPAEDAEIVLAVGIRK